MGAYEDFQQILAELKHKVEVKDSPNSLPPGFEELFKGFKK